MLRVHGFISRTFARSFPKFLVFIVLSSACFLLLLRRIPGISLTELSRLPVRRSFCGREGLYRLLQSCLVNQHSFSLELTIGLSLERRLIFLISLSLSPNHP